MFKRKSKTKAVVKSVGITFKQDDEFMPEFARPSPADSPAPSKPSPEPVVTPAAPDDPPTPTDNNNTEDKASHLKLPELPLKRDSDVSLNPDYYPTENGDDRRSSHDSDDEMPGNEAFPALPGARRGRGRRGGQGEGRRGRKGKERKRGKGKGGKR